VIDGVCDSFDNCPLINNTDQNDSDATKGFGDGSDGSLTVTSSNIIVNNYTYMTTTSVTAGSTNFNVNGVSEFSVGDEILIIQSQDGAGGTAGTYEFQIIDSIGGSTITVEEPLVNAYQSGIFNTTTAKSTQIVRVPQYLDLTVNSGASITAPEWNGFTGGIVVLRVKGALSVTGSIDVTGKGFRGGPGVPGVSNFQFGHSGESTQGSKFTTRATTGNAVPNGGGGTGGGADGSGGGGGYGSAGLNGAKVHSRSRAGLGAPAFGAANLLSIYFGGGGGSSGSHNGGRFGVAGGAGGVNLDPCVLSPE